MSILNHEFMNASCNIAKFPIVPSRPTSPRVSTIKTATIVANPVGYGKGLVRNPPGMQYNPISGGPAGAPATAEEEFVVEETTVTETVR